MDASLRNQFIFPLILLSLALLSKFSIDFYHSLRLRLIITLFASFSCLKMLLLALAVITCIGAAASSSGISQQLADGCPTVSVYLPATSGLLDSFWGLKGPVHLEHQLTLLKFNVVRFTGKAADSPFPSAARAFVIPPLTGDVRYSDVEDVEVLRSFIKSGGLVIVHDAVQQPQAAQDLIVDLLDYSGNWQHCVSVPLKARNALATSTSYARDFLNVRWPAHLEDARTVQVCFPGAPALLCRVSPYGCWTAGQ